MGVEKQKKRIMIVDADRISRDILTRLLKFEYDITLTKDGDSAFYLLQKNEIDFFSALILDVITPNMDGYEFLRKKKEIPELTNIPVIISTGNKNVCAEQKAFELGAWDFISKPYNAEILLCRLQNAIIHSQLALFEQIKHLAEFDELTGIWNKRTFSRNTVKMLEAHPDTKFALFHLDINRFKLINSFYGTSEGDNLLRFLANGLRSFCQEYPKITYGRKESDVFVFCMPYESGKTEEEILRRVKADLKNYKSDFAVKPSLSVYLIEDISIPVEIMLDHAAIAVKQIKDSYSVDYVIYHDDMERIIRREHWITNEMDKALEQSEFHVHYQPKFNLKTGRPSGAEALVRWYHPENGIVLPNVFIPIFEYNGFIQNLDYYVWEQVCKDIHKWMSEGIDVKPVSVNISRVDFYNPQLAQTIKALTDKYNVPASLLNLEITESIFTEDISVLNEIIQQLHSYGFILMIDDFGRDYSSLNILKDIDVDILKIDLRFLSEPKNRQRSHIILKSVICMAKELGIATISEGVELKEHADVLRTLGCNYAQGYLYAKPMAASEYEQRYVYKKI